MQNGIQKFSFALFLALVFSLGFMWPSLDVRVIELTPTDLLFPLAFIVTGAAVVAGSLRTSWHPVYTAILMYIGAMSVSALFSTDRAISLVQLAGVVYVALLAVLTSTMITSVERMRLVFYAWLAGAIVTIVISFIAVGIFYAAPESAILGQLVQRSGAVPIASLPRVSSTFISASMFCNYLTVAAALTLVAYRMGWLRQRTGLILLGSIVIAAAFTFSIALGGLALLIGVWIWFELSRTTIGRISIVSGIGAAIAFLSIAPIDLSRPDLPSSRLLVWADAMRTFLIDPLTGNGVGTRVAGVAYQNTDGSWSFLFDAHSIYLNVAAEAGVIGLGALIVLIIAVLKSAFKKLGGNPIRFGLGVAFIAAFVSDGLTGSFEETRHLWVLIGMIVAAERISTDSARSLRP